MAKTIVINLGDQGAIIFLQSDKSILKKFFLSKLTAEAIEKLKPFFNKYDKVPIYILLDTIGQNYNHKTFPAVSRFDLYSLVKRKFEQEIPKKDLKGKIFIDRDKVTRKWNYLFISSPIDSPLKEWLMFIDTLSNPLQGIYFLPLEMQNFTSSLLRQMQFTKNLRPKWLLIITQNKVSDLRQVATHNDILIFTRLLSKDSMKVNFGEKLKNDILRTCEYLRRFSATFKMKDLMIITITDEETKEKLRDTTIQNVNFLKFTPYEVAQKFGLPNNVVTPESEFFDILMGSVFVQNLKVLRFYDEKMASFTRLFLIFNFLKKATVAFGILIVLSFLAQSYYKMSLDKNLEIVLQQIKSQTQILQAKKEMEFGLEEENIDEIVEIGSVNQMISDARRDPNVVFGKFYEVQKNLGVAYTIRWGLDKFDAGKLSPDIKTNLDIDILLLNDSGNIDDLFKNFDTFTKNLTTTFAQDDVQYSKLPNNIDFNQKYYSFPIKIQIKEK